MTKDLKPSTIVGSAKMVYGSKEYHADSFKVKQELRVRRLKDGSFSLWQHDPSGDKSLVIIPQSEGKNLAMAILRELLGE